MIAEIATAAALSGAAIGYMIGKAGKADMRARADHWRLRADKKHDAWMDAERRCINAKTKFDAIKRARSAAVAKGNTTRRLKREAAKVSA